MAMSTFPGQLKSAELNPLYKTEDNLNKKNFRPISMLPGISKLYESVVIDQLLQFFSQLFHDLVGAYRKGYSCQSILVKSTGNWKNALDKQMFIGALFMDLSKAFDCLLILWWGVPSGVSRSQSGDGSCPVSIWCMCHYYFFALYISALIVLY